MNISCCRTQQRVLNAAAARGAGLGILIFLGVIGVGSGCSRRAASDSDLIAKIGAHEIRGAEFQDWMRRRGVSTNAAEKAALLQEMLDHSAAVQRAQDLGLAQDPEVRRSWENLLVSTLRERQLESRITNALPTQAQIQAWYQTNLAAYTEPAQRRGAILFLEWPSPASAEHKTNVRRKLTEIRTEALEQAKADPKIRGFGALAVKYSQDPTTRYQGGDFGWLTQGRADNRFDPAVPSALFSLASTNEISDVIETPRGAYLVKLLDLRPSRVKPLEAVARAIRHNLLLENRERLEADWKREVRSHYQFKVFPDALARVSGPMVSTRLAPTAPPVVP